MDSYITIRIKATEVNQLDSHLIVGGPKITAAHGLLTALAIKLLPDNRPEDAANKLKGFVYIHHNRVMKSMLDTTYKNRLYPQQRRGAFAFSKNDYVGSTTSQGLQPVATADMEVTLIAQIEIKVDSEKVQSALSGKRFGGGLIRSVKTSVFQNFEDACTSIPGGFFVLDRRDLLQHENKVEAMRSILLKEHGEPFVALATVGFALLNDLREQAGAIHGYPHAFSEPAIGAIQYISKNQNKRPLGDYLFKAQCSPNKLWVLAQEHSDLNERDGFEDSIFDPDAIDLDALTDLSA
tara:strand:- start:1617 stop:2498 length:882 start_codon:yes stop_codon:yes gene_type:complete